MESVLTRDEQECLLGIARASVEAAARGEEYKLPPDLPAALREPGAAFVTCKTRSGELRGCIGLIEAKLPLAETVADMGRAAASRDPRFPPIGAGELGDIRIEVSVLTEPKPIAPEEVEVGVHGLIVQRGWTRGLLLPQVATEHGWDAKTFVEHTCQKAGLPRDAWRRPDTEILAFEAEVFREP